MNPILGNKSDITFAPIATLQQLLAAKEITPSELLAHFYKRIAEFDPSLHALIRQTREQAARCAAQADAAQSKGEVTSTLMGIPVAFSDTFAMEGVPTSMGSQLMSRVRSHFSHPFVSRCDALLLPVIGQCNLSEFNLLASTENRLLPPTKNPWNPAYSPGGSVGGSAAAVAAGFCPIAIAHDFAGGALQSSGYCGIVGFAPTRVARKRKREETVPISVVKSHRHALMARGVEDIWKVYHHLYRGVYGDQGEVAEKAMDMSEIRGVRGGYTAEFGHYAALSPQIERNFNSTVSALSAKLGAALLQPVEVPFDGHLFNEFVQVISVDKYLSFAMNYSNLPGSLQMTTRYFQIWLEHAQHVSGMQYAAGLMMFDWVERSFEKLFEECDLIITPTTPSLPMILSDDRWTGSSDSIKHCLNSWSHVLPSTLAGLPSIAIPCGLTKEGLPLSLQVIGRKGADELLLQFAKRCEEILSF